MARQFVYQAALAAVLFLGTGSALAQSAYAPPPPPQPVAPANPAAEPSHSSVLVAPPFVDVTGHDCTGAHRSHPVLHAIEDRPHPLYDAFTNHPPLGCWKHHNMFGCSSCQSELTFIFGSCRAFFGEQCLKEPPPDELAPMREGTPDAAPPPRARPPFSFCPWCR
jgi:hypothetical protein